MAPTWLGQLPWLIEEKDRAALERELRGVAAERMLRELAQALETLSRDRLVIVALEDLHWSDAASADLLAFLGRRANRARLLVLSTYRPVDAIVGENPIRVVHQSLLPQGRCASMEIEPLSEAEVAALVQRRFEEAAFAPDLAAVVQRRTEGNPLFVVSLLDDLVAEGRILQGESGWRLQAQLGEIEKGVPDDLRQMVRVQVDHLDAAEREAVEAASAAGVSFSAAEVAAALECEALAVEERCEALARRGVLLRRPHASEWPDGTSASTYDFRHALHRDALYEGIPAARRQVLHQRIGERLELAHGVEAGGMSGLLAHHFEEAHDAARASRYLRQAAEVAARRGAPREALALTERARLPLARLPEGFERTLEELLLEIAAGPAMAATLGYAAPEVERLFNRARDLCRALGDGPQLFPVLWGLWAFWAVRGRIDTALELSLECLALAEQVGDRELLLEAHHAAWVTQFFHGDVAAAEHHLDVGLPLYDRAQHHLHVMLFGQDPGVVGLAYRSLVLLARGRAREAERQSDAAIALGRELGHPTSLVFALHFGAWMHEQRGDTARCRELAHQVRELTEANGMPFWNAHATWFAARSLAQDDPAASIAGMHAGMESLRTTGAGMGLPAYLTTLARTHLEVGELDEARRLAEEARVLAESAGEGLTRSDILRLSGDLELASSPGRRAKSARARAEALYREAIAVAGAQGALGLEFRAAVSLAELWRDQRRTGEIESLLRPILARLGDDDLPEVARARALLTAAPRRP